MSLEIYKAILNAILRPATPLAYKPPQHVIMEYYGTIILKHVLHKRAPHLSGKLEYLQKHIYDLRFIYSEDLYSFINTTSIFHKSIILSRKDVSPNYLFEQVITQLMAFQCFHHFLGTNFSDFLHFQHQCGR